MLHQDKPLEGRRVVVTRAAEQASELAARLETLGAEVLLLPLVEFAPALESGPLDQALRGIDHFDWLFLTSRNAVRFFAQRARAIGCDLRTALSAARARPQVAVVGHATEQVAMECAWRVDRVTAGQNGLDLLRELGGEVRGQRVLLPRSDRATRDLPDALVHAGATPVEVVAYRTLAVDPIDSSIFENVEQGEVDVVSFASPSAFSILLARFGKERLRRAAGAACVAAIGPTTAAAIRRAGFAVPIEATVPSAAGLAAAIATYFSKQPEIPGRHK